MSESRLYPTPQDSTSGPDFAGLDLVGLSLQGLQASYADLRRADLSYTDLSNAALQGAVLHAARLRSARLTGIQAAALHARDLDAESCVFDDAQLTSADFSGALFLDASFLRARLNDTRLTASDLRGADLRGADLRGADLSRADIRGARFEGAQLDGIRASGIRYSADDLPESVLAALLDGGAPRPRDIVEPLILHVGSLTGRVGRAGSRWLVTRSVGNLQAAGKLWSSVRQEAKRQFREAAELRQKVAEQRDAEQRRLAAVIEQRRERARKNAGRTGEAERRARKLRQTHGYDIVAENDRPALREIQPQDGQRRLAAWQTDLLPADLRSRLHLDAEERQARADAAATEREASRKQRMDEVLRRERERKEAQRLRLWEAEQQRKAEEARLAAEQAEAEARQAAEKAEAEARKAAEKAEAEARQAAEKAEAEARQAAEKAEAEARRKQAEAAAQAAAEAAREQQEAARIAAEAARRQREAELEQATRREQARAAEEEQRQREAARQQALREAEEAAAREREEMARAEAAKRVQEREAEARDARRQAALHAAKRAQEATVAASAVSAAPTGPIAGTEAAAPQSTEAPLPQLSAAEQRQREQSRIASVRTRAAERRMTETVKEAPEPADAHGLPLHAEDGTQSPTEREQALAATLHAEDARRTQERRRAEEQRRAEAQRHADVLRAEAAQREEGAQREEAARREEIAKRAETERKEAAAKREEAARREEAERRAEAARREEAERRAEAARREEAERRAEAERREEAERRAEAERKAEEDRRRAEQQRQAAEQQAADARRAEASRAASVTAQSEANNVRSQRAREEAARVQATLPVALPRLDEAPALPLRPIAPSRPAWLRLLSGRDAVDVPDGPGVDLSHADLRGQRLGARQWSGANLSFARLDTARLDEANLVRALLSEARLDAAYLNRADLTGADLTGARLEATRLRDARLNDATCVGARLVDADLRGADLRGAQLANADLTGADLRRALLAGADLRGADLSATRLCDIDLQDVILDGANLDQADVAGVSWTGCSVRDARLTGALGLSGRDRDLLARSGALSRDDSLDRLLGNVASRQVRAAVAILALGVGTFLTARFFADQAPQPTAIENRAEDLRSSDPRAASALYAELAQTSQRLADRVGYLLEAADLAAAAGDEAGAEEQYAAALAEAGEDAALSTDVRMRMAAARIRAGDIESISDLVRPVLESQGQPSEIRARALLLLHEASPESTIAALVADILPSSGDPTDADVDFRLALADQLANRSLLDDALAQLDTLAALTLATDQQAKALSARARILDREGQLDEAANALLRLFSLVDAETHTAQAARLALADIRHRQGQPAVAQELVAPLLVPTTDPRVRARAYVVSGRLHEQNGALDLARQAWQDALAIEGVEVETREEARISLARLLIASGDDEAVQAALADLAPEAAQALLSHARLGEARRQLDEAHPAAALDVYVSLQESDAVDPQVKRAARAGEAECRAALGEIQEALRIWRTLLSESPDTEERTYISLQLAQGLLQAGETEEAAAAFATLAAANDPDIRFQGILGQADLARGGGETARARSLYRQVVDRAEDPAFKVRALQELADIALESGRNDEAREAWRTVLTLVSPSDTAAADARTSLMADLAARGSLTEALALCRQAEAAAPDPSRREAASLACAELLEQVGQHAEAQEAYTRLSEAAANADIRLDAAMGVSRCALASGEAPAAIAALDQVSALADSDARRLPWLNALIDALAQAGEVDRLASVTEQRNTLARRRPETAGPLLLEAAQQARTDGDIPTAVSLFQDVAGLDVDASVRDAAALELADTLLEDGQYDGAVAAYTQSLQATDDSVKAAARLGLAQAALQLGDIETAIRHLEVDADPSPDARHARLETLARAYVQEERIEDALSTYEALAASAPDDVNIRAGAERGRGELFLGSDRLDDAETAFQKAIDTTTDPAMQGWATIGLANTLAERSQQERAQQVLEPLFLAEDPEVRAQAHIRSAQLDLAEDRWQAALDRLDTIDGGSLGPGWDATLVEIRCAAWVGLGNAAAARDEWKSLVNRWPDEPEARLPAWLGLADLATAEGDGATARSLAEMAMQETTDPGYQARAAALVERLSP